nr:uncharacterized protein LOC103427865 isoform X2 [Malus domestica]
MNARSSMQGDGRINTSKDDSYLDSYISTIGVEFMEKGGGCGMSGRGREREVYISESSSSPQFQQQRPPLFPKETWTCFFLSAALPIFHQNHILNSSNFEHEMPGEGFGSIREIEYSSKPLFFVDGFCIYMGEFLYFILQFNSFIVIVLHTYNTEFRGVD